MTCPVCAPNDCAKQDASAIAHRARSGGFSGTADQYSKLFNVSCSGLDACVSACGATGGSAEMCAASECVTGTQNYCLPAAVWSNLEAVSTSGTVPEQDGVSLVVVAQPYHDELMLDQFDLTLPDDSTVDGIELIIRRTANFENSVSDGSVRLIKRQAITDVDRAKTEAWNAGPFESVVYGGPTDLWGERWTAADLKNGLGIALTAKYTLTAGNARAYIDSVTAKVYYTPKCK